MCCQESDSFCYMSVHIYIKGGHGLISYNMSQIENNILRSLTETFINLNKERKQFEAPAGWSLSTLARRNLAIPILHCEFNLTVKELGCGNLGILVCSKILAPVTHIIETIQWICRGYFPYGKKY